MIAAIFSSSLPQDFVELGKKLQPTPLARFLYGGITEEILMRFGFMTLAVWVVFKVRKNLHAVTYWIAIVAAALLFALGHLPIVFTLAGTPSPGLISYIMLGNGVAGVAFGWLYWKKGLEAAMIGHIFAHVAMMVAEQVFHLQ
jgi:membrane protease YdiL (CAAX protease family)